MVAEADGGPLAVVAQRMYAHLDRFVAELIEVTKMQIRALDHDPRMADLLKASITENVVAGIHYLTALDTAVEASTAAFAYARALAQRDIPLSALIRAYRIGHARFLAEAMQHASSLEAPQRVPAIVDLVDRSGGFIDQVCDQVGVAYEQERDRWVSRRSGLRQRWVGQLLAGAPVDIPRAEEMLKYRLDGVHVAAVVWADVAVPVRDVVALFERVRSLLAAELDAVGRPLMVPTDEREARLWFSLRSGTGDGDLDRSRLRTTIESSGVRAHLAVGKVAEGLTGFRRSLHQAERVKLVALAGRSRTPVRVVFYAEVTPIALMAGDMAELRGFVGDVLRELATDDERSEWLRETLREFLARNRSYVATAEAMSLHRNTIQYRVVQAMELCGLDVDDPDAVLRVQIALEGCRRMGQKVLGPSGRSGGNQHR